MLSSIGDSGMNNETQSEIVDGILGSGEEGVGTLIIILLGEFSAFGGTGQNGYVLIRTCPSWVVDKVTHCRLIFFVLMQNFNDLK